MKHGPTLFFLRIASSPHGVRQCRSWPRSCGKEDGVNDVIHGIEPNYRGDGGDDAGSGGGTDSSRAALYTKASITGDSTDEQTKEKTLQHAGDDVTNEKSVADEVEKIDKGNAEISARDETTGEDRSQIRNSRETWHEKKKCKQPWCDQKPEGANSHRFDCLHFFGDLHRSQLSRKSGADAGRQHDSGNSRPKHTHKSDCNQSGHETLGAEALQLVSG